MRQGPTLYYVKYSGKKKKRGSIQILLLEQRQVQYLNTLVPQFIAFIFTGLAANRPLWCLVVMNLACLVSKRVADILTMANDTLDELAIKRHGLCPDRHQCGTRRRLGLNGWRLAELLDVMPGN